MQRALFDHDLIPAGQVDFDGILLGFDRVAAALLKKERPAEKAHNERLAAADGWASATATPALDGAVAYVAEAVAPANGIFLRSYTAEHADRLRQTRGLVLDLETTGRTPHAERVVSVSQIGARPYQRRDARRATTTGFFDAPPRDSGNYYVDDFPNCRIETALRVRIITIRSVDDGWTAVWDLDHLAPDDRQQLAHDVLSGKIVIGHNVSFDLAWLRWLTDAEPARVIDSMLVAKWHAHASRLNVHRRAANGDEACASLVKTAGPGSGVGFGLDDCAAAFRLPGPDKIFQLPRNWCVSDLSPEHYAYCANDVDLPLRIIRRALGLKDDANLDAVLGTLEGGPYATDCAPVMIGLARMHRRGMPVSLEEIAALDAKFEAAIAEQTASTIVSAPNILGPVRADLARARETNALRQAVETYLQTQDAHLPSTRNGQLSIAKDALAKARLTKDPIIKGLLQIKDAAKKKETLGIWRAHIGEDGRVHPLLAISTVPGRMSSKEPNAQGLPKDPAFRRFVKAGTGKLIVVADFSQIELRLAAAVAARDLAIVQGWLNGNRKLAIEWWIRKALQDARDLHARGTPPPPPGAHGSWGDAQAAELCRSYYQVLHAGQTMVGALRQGIDLHLLTAVSMADRAGKINLKGTSGVQFLRKAGQQALKQEFAAGRQAAKAVNFGLLYGQSAGGISGDDGLYAYGVTDFDLAWSREEAAEARTLWFELYPEFRFWHIWTTLGMATARSRLMLFGYNGLKTEEKPVWKISTLSGRKMLALGKREALNYPVQGSGAELILKAQARLPEPAQSCLVNVIHDEFLFEALADQAELVRAQAVEAMKNAGDEMLSPYGIPVEVESGIGETWGTSK